MRRNKRFIHSNFIGKGEAFHGLLWFDNPAQSNRGSFWPSFNVWKRCSALVLYQNTSMWSVNLYSYFHLNCHLLSCAGASQSKKVFLIINNRFEFKKTLSPIYTRQDVTLIWTRCDFLYVAVKSKSLVEHFLMGILSRSWSFRIRTWTRNAKLPRLIRFISFKISHRYAPRNTTRNAISL